MGKNKLKKFAEMKAFPNVFEFPEAMQGKWNATVFGNLHPITLELGCGRGEYTTGLSRLYHHRNFIGCDIKGSRIYHGAKAALQENRKNAAFLRTKIDLIGRYFNAGEVDEIWITFPDPHPKRAEARHRLTSWKFLEAYQKVMVPEGKMHLKTDNEALYRFTEASCLLLGLPIIEQIEDVRSKRQQDPILCGITTTYEKRWLDEGRKVYYICWKMLPQAFEPQAFDAAVLKIKGWLLEHNPDLPNVDIELQVVT